MIKSFPGESKKVFEFFYWKHLFEVKSILKISSKINKPNIRLLDIGGGMGINTMILSELFDIECTVVDRMDEFSDEADRVEGNYSSIEKRLNSKGVELIKRNFIDNGLDDENSKFDIITCFSVIEHLPFSPRPVISRMFKYLDEEGFVVVGTPNQVHLFNRIKCALGMNTWEDFDYISNSKEFFGHVREYTSKELKDLVGNSKSNHKNPVNIFSSNYPINSHFNKLSFLLKILILPLVILYNFICFIIPNSKYELIAYSRK
jgi:2-polyprenyl-3-methyl-5-hydroxy-6-metoxy-1,4-benzoquinol methylase